MHYVCVMGCKKVEGQKLHRFPRNAQRRAEWCRILDINPKIKNIYLCNAHISDVYMFGNRLTKYAKPNPQSLNELNAQRMRVTNFYSRPNYQIKIEDLLPRDQLIPEEVNHTEYDNNFKTFIKTEVGENVDIAEDDSSHTSNYEFSSEGISETGEPHKTIGNVEDFEIRKGSNNDMIIKGRYVQTKDYLVVSYTPPRKWTLQEQVKMLDKACEQQLKQIKELYKENYRLSQELRKHDKLLPKLRSLQTHNRFLYAQLKMYKMHEKDRRTRLKERRRRKNDIMAQEKNTDPIDHSF